MKTANCLFVCKLGLSLFATALLFVCRADAQGSDLYVSQTTGYVSVLDQSGNAVSSIDVFNAGRPVSSLGGLAFDGGGNLFVSANDGSITKITPSGDRSLFFQYETDPLGLVFDSQGNLYVANVYGVDRFTPSGDRSYPIANGAPGYQGLAINAAGDVFVSLRSGYVVELVPGTDMQSIFASPGGSNPYLMDPYGLAFDSSGNLYVADSSANTIYKYALNGAGTVFANTGLSTPDGLTFDSAGNLYVANNGNGTVEKFAAGSNVGSVFASGLTGPTFLTFESAPATAPEPSVLAFVTVAAGVTYIGARWRRRAPMTG